MGFRDEAPLRLRPGREGDWGPVLALWDEAVAWLVARGQSGQWGAAPVSASARNRERVRRWTSGGGMTVAELDERVVGVSVLRDARPAYVPAIERPERYLDFLLGSRAHAGLGIGARLVHRAVEDARAAGAAVLRVDCWAGAPALVAWYERQGFVRSETFAVGDWRGQVFELEL